MLDEKALRKPGFSEGESVVLLDGQPWHFPIPGTPGLPPQPAAITVEQARAWKAANPEAAAMPPRFTPDDLMGVVRGHGLRVAGLLGFNYRLTGEDLLTLIPEPNYNDEASLEVWERLAPVLGAHCGPPEPGPLVVESSPPPIPPQAPRLDEQALRSARFTEGPRVVLGDGQSWTFPRPRPLVYPTFTRPDGTGLDPDAKVSDLGPDGYEVGVGVRIGYGIAHRARCDEIAAAPSPFESTCLALALAAELLAENYDLPVSAYADLLAFEEGDAASEAMLSSLVPVLMGRAPFAASAA